MKLEKFQPTIRVFPEPMIEVGMKVAVPEPKLGWTLLGPLGDNEKRYDVNLGLIGDYESLEQLKNLIVRLNRKVDGKDQTFLHVAYPGLEKLRIHFIIKYTAELDSKLLKQRIEQAPSFSNRIDSVGKIVREKINGLMDRHPQPDLLILAYPKIVDQYCIEDAKGRRGTVRKTAVEKEIERAKASHISLDHFIGIQARPKKYEPMDLRSLVKAYCMEREVPIQIIRPHTTDPYDPEKPRREDDATTYWNLVVSMFYKANNLPWRVRDLMDDTIYLGISFFHDKEDPSTVKTALAQIFAIDSEGFVFKGDKAIVDENHSPHVSKQEAKRLIQRSIEVFSSNKGEPPRRVVVHKTSRFTKDELEGFQEGGKDISRIDLLAFGSRDIKLVRWGQKPPIRGTMVRLPDKSILLYTYGYIPFLNVYPGPRVPSPLEILEHYGPGSIDTICQEILALTKLNWNYAKFCIKSPITIGFARRVGYIMRNMPPDIEPKDKFKYYI